MAYTLLTHTVAGASGGNSITTSGIDTTGATLIVVITVIDQTFATPSDSNGNTWTGLTGQAGGNQKLKIYYCASPTVGVGHTFTQGATNQYPSIAVASFSGAKLASPFDQENGTGSTSATTIQPGSITPTEDNELVVIGASWNLSSTGSIDSGYTITDQVNFVSLTHYGLGMAYKIQGSAAATNPTWTHGTAVFTAIASASFKAAAVASSSSHHMPLLGV